jgi:hypothetical protein
MPHAVEMPAPVNATTPLAALTCRSKGARGAGMGLLPLQAANNCWLRLSLPRATNTAVSVEWVPCVTEWFQYVFLGPCRVLLLLRPHRHNVDGYRAWASTWIDPSLDQGVGQELTRLVSSSIFCSTS